MFIRGRGEGILGGLISGAKEHVQGCGVCLCPVGTVGIPTYEGHSLVRVCSYYCRLDFRY
jgi:hypothetical protein